MKKMKKRNRVLIHVTMWMNSENMKLSERCQSQKSTCCTIPSIGNAQNGKSRERESRLVVTKAQGMRPGPKTGMGNGS